MASNNSNVPGTFQVLDHMSRESLKQDDRICYEATRDSGEMKKDLAKVIFKDSYDLFESVLYGLDIEQEVLEVFEQLVFLDLSKRDFLNDQSALASSISTTFNIIYSGNPAFSELIMKLEVAYEEFWPEKGAFKLKDLSELHILVERILDKLI